MEHDAGGDTGAAVGDELAVGKIRQRLGPRRAERAGDPTRRIVDRIRLAAPTVGGPRVDQHEPGIGEPPRERIRADRVVCPFTRLEGDRLDLLRPGPQLARPRAYTADQHRAVVVTEVAQEPPQTLGTAADPVRDDEHSRADAGARGRRREPIGSGKRMPPLIRNREIGEVLVDVEERRARDVAGEVRLPPPARVAELPPAVDEPIPHSRDCQPGTQGSTNPHDMRRRLVIAAGILLALLGVALSAGGAYAYFWDSSRAGVIAPGVVVAGVDVGGLDTAQARSLLRDRVVGPLERPVRLTYGTHSFVVGPDRAGLRVDVGRMLAIALTESRRGGLAARFLRHLEGRRVDVSVPLEAGMSPAALGRVADDVAAVVDRPAHSAKVVP